MKTAIITIALFVMGSIFVLISYGEVYPTAIQIYHDKTVFMEDVHGPLVEDKPLRSEIIATDNNLGLIKLRINTYNRQNVDTIHFRLRETGSSAWIADNTYAVDLFPNGLLYPFGFPAIPDSKGKTYEFELVSEHGTPQNAIGIERGYHAVASVYVFQKETLLGNRHELVWFIDEKIKSLFVDAYFDVFYLMFLLPTFVYLLKRYLSNKKHLMIAIFSCILGGLLIYAYLPISMSSYTPLLLILLFGFEFFLLFHIAISSKHMFYIAILFLIQMTINIVLGKELEANKLAVSVFYLMVISVVLSGIESRTTIKKRIKQ